MSALPFLIVGTCVVGLGLMTAIVIIRHRNRAEWTRRIPTQTSTEFEDGEGN